MRCCGQNLLLLSCLPWELCPSPVSLRFSPGLRGGCGPCRPRPAPLQPRPADHAPPPCSHAMMDLLVDLCLQNHLNPSHHALEIWSSDSQQPLSFKPNTLVGTLNVHTVFLKEKVPEEKAKPGPPKMPEVSRTGTHRSPGARRRLRPPRCRCRRGAPAVSRHLQTAGGGGGGGSSSGPGRAGTEMG